MHLSIAQAVQLLAKLRLHLITHQTIRLMGYIRLLGNR